MTEISTRERAGEYDAIATAKPGEPLFPLQGGDRFAPKCIYLWAEQARTYALKELPAGEDRDNLLSKATAAEGVAEAMQDYRLGLIDEAIASGDKAEIAAVKSSSGHQPDPERARIAALSGIADRIYNSLAELSDAADALSKMGGFAAAEMYIRDAVIAASKGVTLVEPRRHLPRADDRAAA